MSENCIFCKIVAGAIPATRVYEDGEVLAFMDIGPIVKGHTLVIPKAHHETLPELPPALLARVMEAAQRIAAAQLAGLEADGVNLHQATGAAAGQVVPHVHFHVIPRFNNDGHRWNWAATRYRDPAEVQELAGRIRAALGEGGVIEQRGRGVLE